MCACVSTGADLSDAAPNRIWPFKAELLVCTRPVGVKLQTDAFFLHGYFYVCVYVVHTFSQLKHKCTFKMIDYTGLMPLLRHLEE